jgi:hypothetical protein
MHRVRIGAGIGITSIAALALMTAFAGSTSVAKRAGVKKHEVDLLWKPDVQDLYPGKNTVVDTFESSGPPFGDETAETLTPRSQVGRDSRSGKWRVLVNPGAHGPEPGMCFGTYKSDRNVIETTETHQIVQYGGSLRVDGCKNTKKFKNVQPGPYGELQGETFCTVNECRGGLEVTGSMRY